MEQGKPVTLDELAFMVGKGFKEMTELMATKFDIGRIEGRLDRVETRLDRIENLLLTDQLQRIERLEDKVHILEVSKSQ